MKKLLLAGLALCMMNLSLLGADISPADKKLVDAVWDGKLKDVKDAIKAGANVNVKWNVGKMPILATAALSRHKNNKKIVRELLNAGANVNATDVEGISVIAYANSLGKSKKILKMLEEASEKSKLNDELFLAVHNNDVNTVETALHAGADANVRNEVGLTILMYAIYKANATIVKLLLDAGADKQGSAASNLAQYHGRCDIIQMLK